LNLLDTVSREYRLDERDVSVRACSPTQGGRGYFLCWDTIDDGPSLTGETAGSIFAERAVPLIDFSSKITLRDVETSLPEIMNRGWCTAFAGERKTFCGHTVTLHCIAVSLGSEKRATLPISGETSRLLGSCLGQAAP